MRERKYCYRGERIPRTNSRFAPLNLVGTRSTASLTSVKYGDAVERVPTIPKRFRGRGASFAAGQPSYKSGFDCWRVAGMERVTVGGGNRGIPGGC